MKCNYCNRKIWFWQDKLDYVLGSNYHTKCAEKLIDELYPLPKQKDITQLQKHEDES